MWIEAKHLSKGDTIKYRNVRKWGWFEITNLEYYDSVSKTNSARMRIYHTNGVINTSENMEYRVKSFVYKKTYGERIFLFRDGGYICKCSRLVPIHLKCKHK